MIDQRTIKPAVFTCREGEGVRVGSHGATVQAIEEHRLVLVRDDDDRPCVLRTGDRVELPSATITVAAIGVDGKKRASLQVLPRYLLPELQLEFRSAASVA